MLHVFELKHEVDQTTVCIEFVGQCFFQFFFRGFFFLGGGGGGLKLRSYCRNFFHLPYLSRKYAFSVLRSNNTKITGPIFTKFGTVVHHTIDLRKIWHLSFQKCESRNFSFLFIPLTRTPMFRIAMYSHARYFDPLVYLFIYLNEIAGC